MADHSESTDQPRTMVELVLTSGVHVVDAIRRVPSGKIDRAALPGLLEVSAS